jgi:hypothetical protein
MRSDAAAEAREMLEQAHTASNHLTSDAIHHIHRTRETLVQAHSQFQRMRSGVVEQLQAFTDSMLLLEEQIVAALATLESEHAQLGHLSMPAVSPANEGRGLGLYMPSEQEEQPWVMFVPDEARQTIAGQ